MAEETARRMALIFNRRLFSFYGDESGKGAEMVPPLQDWFNSNRLHLNSNLLDMAVATRRGREAEVLRPNLLKR